MPVLDGFGRAQGTIGALLNGHIPAAGHVCEVRGKGALVLADAVEFGATRRVRSHEIEFAHAVARQEFSCQEVQNGGLAQASTGLRGSTVFGLCANALNQTEVPAQDVSVGVASRKCARAWGRES